MVKKCIFKNPVFWITLALILIGATVLAVTFLFNGTDPETPPVTTTTTLVAMPDVEIEGVVLEPISLEEGLIITKIGNYSGKFFEDGSDDAVTDVMFVTVKNTSEKDLQYCRFNIYYPNYTARFQITNLPAGESVIVQEDNRHTYVDEEYRNIKVFDLVFFEESMNLWADRFSVTEHKGQLQIKNQSDVAVTGDIYIYYKNADPDYLYGGITYRAKIVGGLKPGETKSIDANHFSGYNCRLMMITFGE